MSDTIKRKVKVLNAEYIPEVDSVLILGECQEGRFRQQILANNLLRSIYGSTYVDIPYETRVAGLIAFAEGLKKRAEPFIMEFDPSLDKAGDNPQKESD